VPDKKPKKTKKSKGKSTSQTFPGQPTSGADARPGFTPPSMPFGRKMKKNC
jgi:hypothetical protein